MATITLQGNPIHTVGNLPAKLADAPAFVLTKADLSDITLQDLRGKSVVLNIFPSIDTTTCALSVRKFNNEANNLTNTTILCISMDLPFAQKRFCGIEGLNNIVTASGFRHPEFGAAYGVTIKDGPLRGLLSRAVVIIDPKGKVAYTEQVKEIAEEPNYDAAMQVLKHG